MPLGLGRLVGTVISSKGFTTNPEQVAREYWERTGRRVAPNGSLMRTHPLGVICLLRGEEEAFEIAARISRATHVDPRMFEELITDLIMRGGDADTNACFAGALLGGHLGYSYLPDHWKHGLKYEEWLLGKSDALCQVLGLKEGDYDGKGDKDTEVHAGQPVPSQEQMEVRWMVLQQDTQRKMEAAAKAATSKASGSGWSLPWAKDKAKR
ncbi:hypothetical protein N0V88_003843 [Collariella sp. IMI 366227]|nr:hypothetical protein N0V88_003843 [Collariella sp. IMI 366227]